ncbi:MAG: peptide chain release factor-like protein [Dehalococcoidia bacterium]|nr:peptide chain release factor-like protein [Dehalococcoidia bacterium]
MLAVTGKTAMAAFANEPGGHRWQGPSGRGGRIHTSTVTVVVQREPTERELVIPPGDLAWSTCRSGGAGGQHVNKTESAVRVEHLPTGLAVRVESERSQAQNRSSALSLLRAKLLSRRDAEVAGARQADRRAQHGGGARGDKRRTIQEQNDMVVDHVTGKRVPLRDYLRGAVDQLSPTGRTSDPG